MRTALQQALYNLLQPELSCPVYDDVPQHAAMPYVVIGEDSFASDDTDDSRGGEATCEIHIWSDGRKDAGRKKSKQIADEVYELLHQTELNVDGYSLAVALWESSDSLDDADGIVRDALETYRVILHE